MSAPLNPEGGIFWVILKLFVSNKIKKIFLIKWNLSNALLKTSFGEFKGL